MATKTLTHSPDNSEQDAFAMDHRHAITMRSADYSAYIMTSEVKVMREYQRKGWRVIGEISAADFGY